jgi:hypothetical protein
MSPGKDTRKEAGGTAAKRGAPKEDGRVVDG